MRKKHAIIAGVLTAAALATTAVYADRREGGEGNEAAALAQAKVSLVQAITAAEQHVNGKAARAELEDENGKLVYEVEVLAGNTFTDVKVDIATGQVMSAQADTPDRERGEGQHEGHERK